MTIDVTQTSDTAMKYINTSIEKCIKERLKPPPSLDLVEWADTYRFLPDNSAESGRWKTDRVMVAKQPMLSVTDPDVQEVTIMCCIQLMKHLAIDTPMLTTSGWKTMADMVEGDRVYGSDGKECNVLAVSEITTQEPCYKITFSDGAEIVCSESHNWNVDDSEGRAHTVNTITIKGMIKKELLSIKAVEKVGGKTVKNKVERRYFSSIEKIENVPVRCIAVDSSDHLYLCGRELIATHNTELMINTALYYMHQEPSPIMYVAPKKDLAEAWSKERLVKSVTTTPVLKDIFSGNRRGEGNTITQKQFAGGQISIVSARNPSDLAMRACRIMLFDECDKYPSNAGTSGGGEGGEGDPIAIGWGRATTYGKRAKKILACSPTVKHKSRIEQEYEKSNMSIFQQRCPHCNELQTVDWNSVKIPKHEDGTFDHQNAQICCNDCGSLWSESDRHKSIREGAWLIRKPHITWHHGYQVSALASPFTPVAMLAKEFSDAQGNPESLKAFKNTRLAETWAEAGEKPDWRTLYDRRSDYKMGEIPTGGVILTCGIDVQKDCLYYEIVAWGYKNRSWSVDQGVIAGTIEEDSTKEALTIFCDATYKDENGYEVPLSRVCIDSGFNTNEVYSFIRTYGSERVVAIKGNGNQDTALGTPRAVDVKVNGQRFSRGIMLWNIGSSVLKEQFYRWLRAKLPTEEQVKEGREVPSGYCEFPQHGEEYFKQITSEQLVTRTNNRGYTTSEWEKTRKDNHLLDCRVYARAGAVMMQIDRMTEQDFDDILSKRIPLNKEQVIEQGMKSKRKKKSGWIKR